MSKNIVWSESIIGRKERESMLGQNGVVIWMTGLSGSGKSTIAKKVQEKLHEKNKLAYILDGDNIRHGLNKDLGFSKEDRIENLRRITEVGKLFVDLGVITIVSFISPYRQDREVIRNSFLPGEFIEVYVKCSLEECEKRDVKGLYKKARDGVIKNFTGIDSEYEAPIDAEVVLDTENKSVNELSDKLIDFITNS
ncbi:adenylyl-sulfate kinase [Ilyobacter polytropus]|uniref:Adenylyl-sulfate kinase n=1 Tax=Ilyobacter polytropus (strain ATCC 51220 / DSM 2926 / LMG 16218 / CuHBu1) TaxID=572544 RepID=E3HDY4_ILYPC|nr:adenylyl-sulfate kinase [Ilyobacter polytropus]ADO84596.1 adenylylsulfate kinase [Ilyobacter polytropus DSM 2926]